MRALVVAVALSASTSQAGLFDPQCDATCGAGVGISLAAAWVIVTHAVFFAGLARDEPTMLRVGGASMLVQYGISALVASWFVLDAMLSRRDVLHVAGSGAWLAVSVGHLALAAYGVHRSTITPAGPMLSAAVVPGGGAATLSVSW